MTDNVEVQFKAETSGAYAGVQQMTQAMEEFHGKIESLSGPLVELGEAVAAAFAIEKIADWSREMTEAGVNLARMEEQLGMSAQQINVLSFAAENSEQQVSMLVRAFTTFSRVAEEAQRAGTRQAEAFQAMGINAKQYLAQGHDMNDLLQLSVQKLAGYQDGLEKAALQSILFGGRSAQLTHVLSEWATKQDELNDAVNRSGVTLKGFEKVSDDVQHKYTELDGAAKGFSERIYTMVGPALEYIIQINTAWLELINKIIDKIIDLQERLAGLLSHMSSPGELSEYLRNGSIDDFGTPGGPNDEGKSRAPGLPDAAGMKKAMDEALALQKAYLAQSLALDKGNYDQEIADATRYFEWVKTKYGEQSKEAVEAATKITQIENQEIQKVQQSYVRMFDTFNQGLRGMINGTSTWRSTMTNMVEGFFFDWLKNVEKMAAHWIAAEHIKTAATVEGNAVRSASEQAAAHAASAIKFEAALKDIKTDMAKTYAGVYGFFSPVLGPFAAIPAAASAAIVGGMEALLPSYEIGTPYVPNTGPAMLHKGERVLTAKENLAYSSGGGGQTSITIHAMDAQSFSDYLAHNADSVVDALGLGMRNGHGGRHI